MQDTPEPNTKASLGDRLLELTVGPFFDLFCWRRHWGFFVLMILLIVGGYQMIPGREFFDLGWPNTVYFVIVGAAGALVGMLSAKRPVMGLPAGAVAAVGSLGAIALLFEYVPQIPTTRVWAWVNVVALAIGLLPGIALYGVVNQSLPEPAGHHDKGQPGVQSADGDPDLPSDRSAGSA